MATMTIKYGVLTSWVPDDALLAELAAANRLRNQLVALETSVDTARQTLWESFPSVAAVSKELRAVDEQLDELFAAAREEKIRSRSDRVSLRLDRRITQVSAQARQMRAERREAIREIVDNGDERALATLAEIRARRFAQQKALRQEFCGKAGPHQLYWATAAAIFDHHNTAVDRIARQRSGGRPAQLRPRSFDGTGTLAVRLQRGSDEPARTPAMIADHRQGRWRNVLAIPWLPMKDFAALTRSQRYWEGGVTVRMRYGNHARKAFADLPIRLHRVFPDHAEILGAQLTVRAVGNKLRGTLAVTATVPDPPPPSTNASAARVAIHIGWRNTEVGLQVATWAADQPLSFPDRLSPAISCDPDGRGGRILLPARISERIEATRDVQSKRDRAFEHIKQLVIDHLEQQGDHTYIDIIDGRVETVTVSASDVRSWQKPTQLRRLATGLEGPTRQQVLCQISDWDRRDKQLWYRLDRAIEHARNTRQDLYRNIAIAFVSQASQIILDDFSVAKLAALQDAELPPRARRAVGRRRNAASPGELRSTIQSTAAREGVASTVVSVAELSRQHDACGFLNPSDDRYLECPVRCEGCGRSYDPDRSAVNLMINRAAE